VVIGRELSLNLPAGQRVQAFVVFWFVNLPGEQERHDVWPIVPEKVPAAQDEQVAGARAAPLLSVVTLKVPSLQLEQLEEPTEEAKVPAAQVLQELSPEAEVNLPIGQRSQDAEPVILLKLPGGHGLQVTPSATSEKVPTGQGMFSRAPSTLTN
jgi:hypothetical protein